MQTRLGFGSHSVCCRHLTEIEVIDSETNCVLNRVCTLPLLCQRSYVLYSQTSSVPSTLCILEHEGLTVQSSHSSPFMLTMTDLPCPLADLFIGSVLSLRPLLFSRHGLHQTLHLHFLPPLPLPPALYPSPLSSREHITPVHCHGVCNLADDEA